MKRRKKVQSGRLLYAVVFLSLFAAATLAYLPNFSDMRQGAGSQVAGAAVLGGGIFSDDFETGDSSKWTSSAAESGNTLSVTGLAAQSGSYGLRVTTGTTNDDANLRKQIAGQTDLYARTYIRLNQNVGSGYHKGFITASSAADGSPYIGILALRTTSSYTNRLFSYVAGTYRDTGLSLTAGQWYCIEMHLTVNSAAGRIQVWKDDVLVQDISNLNTGSTPVSWMRYGADVNSVASSFDMDDFVVDTVRVGCSDIAPPVRSNGQPTGALPSGTTQTTVSLNTNEQATCRHSTAPNTLFSDMSQFSNTDSTSHSTTVSGLTDGNTYNYYVKCQDTAGNVNTEDFLISFNVAVPDTVPPTASVSINSGAASTSSTAVTLSLSCSDPAGIRDVRYSNDGNFDTEQFEAYATSKAWTLATGDGTKTVYYECTDNSGNPTVASDNILLDTTAPATAIASVEGDTTAPYEDITGDGATQIVVNGEPALVCRWYDTDTAYNPISGTSCTNAITQATCTVSTTVNGNYAKSIACTDQAGNGQSAAGNLDVSWTLNAPDATPPSRSNGQPSGTLASGTTQATLSLNTDEQATCKYSTTAGTSYSAMIGTFTNTNALAHSTLITGLTDGNTYNYYVKCQDTAGNANTNDFTITFSITTSFPSPPVPATLTRYPYLQNCAAGSALVAWKTNVATDSTVEYGLTQGYGSTASNPALVTDHAIQLTGLQAGATYYYRVRGGGNVLASETFRANTAAGQPFSFVVVGDSGEGSAQQQQVAAIMDQLNPNLFVHSGDVIYPSGEANYYDSKFFVPYKDIIKNVCVFPSLGNHDVRTLNGQPYLDAFYLPVNSVTGDERYYSFDFGDAHFTVVDSTLDMASSTFISPEALAMKEWVRQDVSSTTKPWKFALFHHSPYSAGLNHGSDMRMRNELSPIFEEYNVDLVIAGHEHNYHRSTVRRDYVPASNGVVYVHSGGGGAGLYGAGTAAWTAASAYEWHTVMFSVYGNTMVMNAVDNDGNIFDTATINKGQPDSTAPVISQLGNSEVTSAAALVSWQTDDLSNTKVEYGITTALGSTAAGVVNLTSYNTAHAIRLSNLGLGTTYYYRAVSCNLNNVCSTSATQSFTTANPPVTTLSATNNGDTTLDSAFPTNDEGTWATLMLSSDGGRTISSPTKWDISSIPSSNTIRKATLRLYVSDHQMEGADKWKVNFYHIYDYPTYSIGGQAWFEGNSHGGACTGSELCWATRPTTAGQMNLVPLNTEELPIPTKNVFREFTVTNVVQEAVAAGESKVTIYMTVERLTGDLGLDQVFFRSKEIGGANVPQLIIEHHP